MAAYKGDHAGPHPQQRPPSEEACKQHSLAARHAPAVLVLRANADNERSGDWAQDNRNIVWDDDKRQRDAR
jgi:hypothetical protein